MSLAAWLGAARKCSTTVVSLDLVLGLSMVRRCSLKRCFKRRLVSPIHCKLQRLHCSRKLRHGSLVIYRKNEGVVYLLKI